MPMPSDDDWVRWQNHVLATLERQEGLINGLSREIGDLSREVVKLSTKAGLISSASGIFFGALAAWVFSLFGRGK